MLVVEHVRGEGSGADIKMESGWVLTMRDGTVVHVRPYVERKEGFEAVGLRDRAPS